MIEPGKLARVPLTSLHYTLPADGLPLLPHWKGVAGDIFFQGYQPLREPMEVRLRDPAKGTMIKTVTGTCKANTSILHVLVILCNFKTDYFPSNKSDLDSQVGPMCS